MAGLNIADLFCAGLPKEGKEMCEPKVEQLLVKLKRLQQEKRDLEEEILVIRDVSEPLRKELEALQTESYELEGIHKEKNELCQKLQYQCEESEQDFARQLSLNKSSEEMSKQHNCDIHAIKLKHRKLRMKFENQLYQLIEQQKSLYSVFMPERLPAEIEAAENTKDQLLTAEKQKMAQVSSLEEEADELKLQTQATVAVAVQEE